MKYKIPSFFLTSSIIFILLVVYKSEFVWEGLRRSYYIYFYIIGIFAIIFSVITYFLNKKFNQILLITFLSTILSVYLFEYYISYLKVDKSIEENSKILKKKTGKDYDKRSRTKVFKDLKKEGNKVTLSFFPEYFVYKQNLDLLPLSGISNINTILCSDQGEHLIFKSDKYGFRNENSIWDEDEIDYLIVGDSFAQGFCVEDPKHISETIKKNTNKKVLNIAYGSNGPLLEFASINEYLPKKTHNVLWFYFEGNDLENLDMELKNDILKKYLYQENFSQNLKKKQNKINKIIEYELKENLSIKNYFNKFLKLKNTRKFIKKTFSTTDQKKLDPKILENLFLILKKTKKILSKETKFYFVYLPDFSRYDTQNHNFESIKIKNFIKQNNIELIDVHEEIFSNYQNPKTFFNFQKSGHYNEAGYKVIAEKIIEIIEKNE